MMYDSSIPSLINLFLTALADLDIDETLLASLSNTGIGVLTQTPSRIPSKSPRSWEPVIVQTVSQRPGGPSEESSMHNNQGNKLFTDHAYHQGQRRQFEFQETWTSCLSEIRLLTASAISIMSCLSILVG